VEEDHYQLLTTEVRQGEKILGFLQVAELSRVQAGELTPRAILYLIVSAAISLLTFFVGLFFARSSLKPAEQMMERLEQFTQDASHELRTPIAALSSSLDLALRSGKHKEGIESAKEDVTQVSILVERLLELARLDKFVLQREEVDLSVLTETVIERHRGLVDGNVIIKSEVLSGVTVSGDPALLRQVIGNLLSNAIKFSKAGMGTITVRLTKDKLSVEDEGVGITKEDLPHIFDRFFQAEDSRSNGGLGLGLALVKRIVDLHGWKIGVKSKEGEGTTFTVRFKQA
jgi:signal transduction histidine kinase